ncbi:ankyrin repeat domain-containing protein [Reinekea thalattae]|uniref:Ankyrin repeat domain-containing protein n=1 Tax=Reinekea thalattae TaxID=2593301 RepID=A0A5C8ZB80_9GAMM|nr:ankyrin repeat domain-containing protein [Reinekea thalattae]TXR54539.1 ankyrin repeat domain-containing protein [Reinekea thalattae]
MASFPSFEKIILSVHSALGLQYSPKKKKSLLARTGVFMEHQQKVADLIQEIFEELAIEETEAIDIMQNLMSSGSVIDNIRLKTWTYGITDAQVVYHIASCLIMPQLGRHLAFWQSDSPIDKGMPGGYFWFLPFSEQLGESHELKMPVQMVVDWFLDLMGVSLDKTAQQMGLTKRGKDEESLVKTLRNWKDGKTTPFRSKIDEYFTDLELTFNGTFSVDTSLPAVAQFEVARGFISKKGLTPGLLKHEVPLDRDVIDNLLNASPSDLNEDLMLHFVALMINRYSQPSISTVVKRLKVARACEAGYKNLCKLISGNSYTFKSADPAKNKTLQLIKILELSFNLTIQSLKRTTEPEKETRIFANSVPFFLKDDVFSGVQSEVISDIEGHLAEHLNITFRSLIGTNDINDVFPISPQDQMYYLKRKVSLKKRDISITSQAEKISVSSPNVIRGKDLKKVNDFDVLYRTAFLRDSYRNRMALVRRMKEVKTTSLNKLEIFILELSAILNNDGFSFYQKDTEARVSELLQHFEKHPERHVFEPFYLDFSAKHKLYRNDFDGARKLFRKALEVSENYCFGEHQGGIARDLLSLELAVPMKTFNLNSLESIFSRFIGGLVFEDSNDLSPVIENYVPGLFEYFGKTLYTPYIGYPKAEIISELPKEVIRFVMEPSKQLAREEICEWINKHFSDLAVKSVSGGRNESILVLLIKIASDLPRMKEIASLVGFSFDVVEKNYHLLMELLIELIPSLSNKADFKRQTPLMLAANNGFDQIVAKLILAGAELDYQDFKGRTALHSSVASRSQTCFEQLTKHQQFPRVIKLLSSNEANVLHTAVRAGNYPAVEYLANNYPELVSAKDDRGGTPIDWAIFYSSTHKEHRKAMAKNGRQIGDYKEFQEITWLLTDRFPELVKEATPD